MTTFKRFNGTDWEYIGLPNNVGMSPQTLGYAEVTTNQSGISTETDLTGFAVTVTVPAGRRLRITVSSAVSVSNVGARGIGAIKEGGTALGRWVDFQAYAAGAYSRAQGSTVISPTAGSHTYKATLSATAGTVQTDVSATSPGFILVEDITGSTLPYQPASVPVGQLAYAQVVANQGSIVAAVALTGLSVNIAVPAGRQLRISGHIGTQNDTANGGALVFLRRDGVTVQTSFSGTEPVATEGHTIEPSFIDSPSAGAHTYDFYMQRANTGTATMVASTVRPAYILVEDITPTPAPSDGAPGSTLGYAQVLTSQGSITAPTDLNGLSTTVTVPAGRRIRVSAQCHGQNTNAGVLNALYIKEGATIIQKHLLVTGAVSLDEKLACSVILTPSAGSHTYKLQADRSGGTMIMNATAEIPAYILVEDITGSVWPEGSAVTAGMIASEEWTAWVPVISQGVTPAQSINYAKYFKIGRMVVCQASISFTGSGTAANNIVITGYPVPAAASSVVIGTFRMFDSGNTNFVGTINGSGTNAWILHHDGDGNSLGTGTGTISNGDFMQFQCTYEAAS